MRWQPLAWLAGLLGLPLAHYWLAAKIEPFYSSIYCFLWWFYILAVDFAVWRLRGSSLLNDRPKEFLFLTLWSVPVWILFEAVNLRIQNWYYVMAPWSISWGVLFLAVAFGTVLPGIFETMELVLALIERLAPGGRIASRPFTVTAWNLRAQWGLGLAMLALVLPFPDVCFCLTWGFAFFLTEPICYWARRAEPNPVGRSLLGQLARGDSSRLIALLVAGVVCGGLWEAWNFTARTKWIYSVPFFDELKLGEMPVLGFLGFPPFALECYALVNFLSLLRDGRHWELSAAENGRRRGFSRRAATGLALAVPLASLACAGIATWYSIASFSIPVDFYFADDLGAAGVAALREHHALEGDEFLRLKERPAAIKPELYARMRRLVALSEWKGMGLRNALALEALNIRCLEELAQAEPSELARQLQARNPRVRLEEVRIWVRAARRLNPA